MNRKDPSNYEDSDILDAHKRVRSSIQTGKALHSRLFYGPVSEYDNAQKRVNIHQDSGPISRKLQNLIGNTVEETVTNYFGEEYLEAVEDRHEAFDEDLLNDVVAEYLEDKVEFLNRRYHDERDFEFFKEDMLEDRWLPLIEDEESEFEDSFDKVTKKARQ